MGLRYSYRRWALYRDQSVHHDLKAAALRLGWTEFVRGPIRKIPYDGDRIRPADFYATIKNQAVVVLIEHLADVPLDVTKLAALHRTIGYYATVWACWICRLPVVDGKGLAAVSQSEMEAADEMFWRFVDDMTQVSATADEAACL